MDRAFPCALSYSYHPTTDRLAMLQTISQQQRLKKHVCIMVMVAMAMFGFGFALIPLYNAFCKVTGLNGKTENEIAMPVTHIDTSRFLNLELLASINENIQFEFYAQKEKFMAHPGEYIDTAFWVRNLTDKPVVIQAIPSVAPGLAAKHVKKVVCFCFQRQDLGPNQVMKMPLRFTVASELPKKYNTVTLSYTLFDVTHT